MEQDQVQPTVTEIVVVAVENTACEVPAEITQKQWDLLRWQVYDTHRAITELEAHLKPALAHITSGNFSLGSMLFGGKGKK